MTQIKTKRVYQQPEASDGYRILVDKFWPHGEKKEEVPYDLWAKEVAPSDELRQWFHTSRDTHWNEFREKYKRELKKSEAVKELIKKIEGQKTVTLLYSSKDTEDNNAVVLQEYLEEAMKK